MKHWNNKGFTVIDVIIVTAIISILTALVYPTMTDFLLLKKEGLEQQEQQEILKMMQAMSLTNTSLTEGADVAVFATDVRAFGSVAAGDITEDAFGYPRYYRGVVKTEIFRDASVDVHYTFLYSTGVDGCWGEEIDCTQAGITANVNALLGNVVANYGTNFNGIEVPVGDYLVKYTDFQEKIKGYKKTIARLNKLSAALGEYGRLKYYEGIAENEDPNLIYYPPSDGPAMALIYDNVEGETSNETTNTDIYGAGGSDVILNDDTDMNDKIDRRLGMIALTRILGLPDEYCCSAMKTFTDNAGNELEEGFFYYSNPKARIDVTISPAVCGAEALLLTDRKLPPRLTVEEDPCGK